MMLSQKFRKVFHVNKNVNLVTHRLLTVLLTVTLLLTIVTGAGCNLNKEEPDPGDNTIETAPNRLLTDEELRTKQNPNAPSVKTEWADWIKQNYNPIRSLTVTSDFSDLQFLQPLLRERRIVQLGESSHGVKQFNQVKVRLIKFLHEEMGYDVIAFESGIYDCYIANKNSADYSGLQLMQNSIYGVWETEEVKLLFDYIKETQNTERPLILAGFDMKPSSPFYTGRPGFFRDIIEPQDSEYAQFVFDEDTNYIETYKNMERLDFYQYCRDEKDRLYGFYQGVADYIDANMDALKNHFPGEPDLLVIARQTARSLAYGIEFYSHKEFDNYTDQQSSYYRDLSMAENLGVLAEEVYPGKKIIVWAHNFHISHDHLNIYYIRGFPNMGSHVIEQFGPELYTVGIFMYRGQAANNNQSVYDIKTPQVNSLEGIFYQARCKYMFVDMLNEVQLPGNSWMFENIKALHWGTTIFGMIPRNQYDAILFIDTVEPPVYIDSQ